LTRTADFGHVTGTTCGTVQKGQPTKVSEVTLHIRPRPHKRGPTKNQVKVKISTSPTTLFQATERIFKKKESRKGKSGRVGEET